MIQFRSKVKGKKWSLWMPASKGSSWVQEIDKMLDDGDRLTLFYSEAKIQYRAVRGRG